MLTQTTQSKPWDCMHQPLSTLAPFPTLLHHCICPSFLHKGSSSSSNFRELTFVYLPVMFSNNKTVFGNVDLLDVTSNYMCSRFAYIIVETASRTHRINIDGPSFPFSSKLPPFLTSLLKRAARGYLSVSEAFSAISQTFQLA